MLQTALLKGASRDLCVPLKCPEGIASVLGHSVSLLNAGGPRVPESPAQPEERALDVLLEPWL